MLALRLAERREFYFVATEADLAAIAIDDAPEEALLGSTHFDLAGLIEDEAILQLPISPRHARCAPRAPAGRGDPAAATGRPQPFAGLREQLRGAGAPADGRDAGGAQGAGAGEGAPAQNGRKPRGAGR